jgi:hypothetical protein
MNYCIEILYLYKNKIKQKEIESKTIEIEIEINNIGKETNGTLVFYGEKITIVPSCFFFEKLKVYGLNYNWIFNNIEDIQNFVLKLLSLGQVGNCSPNYYKILWIHKNPKTFKKNGYVVYNMEEMENTKEVQNMEEGEKKLHNIILNRTKLIE